MLDGFSLSGLPVMREGRSRAINAENPTGEPGRGGMAASALGAGRKGSPCLPWLHAGETVTLAHIHGAGIINHIWCTVTDRTAAGRYVLRDLVLRMYWDGEATPSVEAPLGDFFANGFGRGYTVQSLPIVVNPKRGMNCYFPMPFASEARITLQRQGDAIELRVVDDGRGGAIRPGNGIDGMCMRIAELGGVVQFEPVARGTQLRAVVPLEQAA